MSPNGKSPFPVADKVCVVVSHAHIVDGFHLARFVNLVHAGLFAVAAEQEVALFYRFSAHPSFANYPESVLPQSELDFPAFVVKPP
jgi:hypothetical protein